MDDTITARKRERKRALLCAEILAEHWGVCEDADFTIGCACCLASHVRRCMLDEPTPNGDKAFQAAMQAEAEPPALDTLLAGITEENRHPET